MSKLLTQSKNLLPMVVQKSGTEAVKVLESQSAVSTDATEKVPPPQEILKAPNINDHKDENVRILFKLDHCERPVKEKETPRQERLTMFYAFQEDLKQLQEWLAALTARSHMRLMRREAGMLRPLRQGAEPPTVHWLESRPQLKEDVPVSLMPDGSKKATVTLQSSAKNPEAGAKKGKNEDNSAFSLKSNVVQAVVDRAPDWQKSISAQLGALQKKVIKKLSQ